ncbi:MAG TPA: nitrite reductase [Acidobacteriaceae bacterium]
MSSIETTPVSATPGKPAKETKAQKSERLKLEKNPWEAWQDVREFARQGITSVLPDWAGFYFKWWGIYTQGDGVGAVGGVGGEGKATEYFMMRIGIPNGIVKSNQLRGIADIVAQHARGVADITTRQNIQMHWLTIESLPVVVDALEKLGLSPKGACGDVVRNVTGSPLAGVEKGEILDASPLALKVAHYLTANPAYFNLPRKFKICITGSTSWDCYPEINDIGLTPAVREVNGKQEIGYSLRVGGGLSREPHIAVRLDCFVRQEQAEAVVYAVTDIFREQLALRESRTHARMKYLFLQEGWTAEKFLGELEAKLGYKLEPAVPETVPDDVYRDHAGIHPQKQDGLSYVGASVLRGRMTAEQLHAVADLAEKYGSGEIRCTVMQNFVIINVPNAKAQELATELKKIGIEVQGTNFFRGTVACTGTEFCKLAITETKGFAKWLVGEMEGRMPGFDQQLRINVTGCPNSCGQSWIADIGLEGKKIKHDGVMKDAFYFAVGGALGEHAGIARQIGYRAVAEDVPQAIEQLLRGYLKERGEGENLRSYFRRKTDDDLRTLIAGEPVVAIEHDKPTGRPPVGVN